MERDKLENIIKQALDRLYKNDSYLIFNQPAGSTKDCHVSERGIVFRFGLYFYELLNEIDNDFFNELSLDVEYNRNFYEKKTLYSFTNGTFPDMIIHKRSSNDCNFLVLEFKIYANLTSQPATNCASKTKSLRFTVPSPLTSRASSFAVVSQPAKASANAVTSSRSTLLSPDKSPITTSGVKASKAVLASRSV